MSFEATGLHEPDNERTDCCAATVQSATVTRQKRSLLSPSHYLFSYKIKYAFIHEGLKRTAHHLCH